MKSSVDNAQSLKFEKEHTLITKGILIILMLVHHVLNSSFRYQHNVQTLIKNDSLLTNIVSMGSICVSGFAFLSAYGMTQSLKAKKDLPYDTCFKWMCIRLIKLESSIVFIFFLAVFYKRIILQESIGAVYGVESGGDKILLLLLNAIGMSDYFGTPNINMTWWYLHFAIILIITMPFLYMLYEKFRYLLIPAVCVLPMAIFSLETMAGAQNNYIILLPSTLLGIAFAYEDWFEKLKQLNCKILKVFIPIIILILAYYVWTNLGNRFAYIFVVVLPFIVYEFIAGIPILSSVLKFIGEHATNIFLIHTFIYLYWYADFIYSFQKSWLIIGVLLIICIILSVMIELLKKISGYNRLITKIVHKIE
ncbi:MAG: acyltransferase [Roseburia sp.]|nr:acyltransferase [Ruminococcus sp.]MCM1155711.1 acyltransferase [Roseburia sp.]MCM1242810.1 acyltransferase [Roseburia sp.]